MSVMSKSAVAVRKAISSFRSKAEIVPAATEAVSDTSIQSIVLIKP
jgi:hypothetical protein